MKYSLFRIYVWYSKFEDEWVAEGKWWSEDEFGFKKMKGTIGHHSFGESLSDAIDDILNVAKDMNIQIRDNLFLGYSEEFEYWNEEDYGRENPFPKPDNFDIMLKNELYKRGWA